jgi:2-polyprenyl-3-methyl-5-hydroxy-6-metoxy-1,4-benzoquinol methylase
MKVENCPVCYSRETKEKYPPENVDGKTLQIVECRECRHYFTLFFSDIDVNKYYDDKDYRIRDNRETIFHKIQEVEYGNVLKSVRKLTSGKEVLDFGSGKGIFLSVAKKEGYQVAGVETSGPRADYARRIFGLEINSDFFSQGCIFGRRFPVITMFHVLEHIPDTRMLLKHLYADNLTADGVAVLEVPNFGSWQSMWSGSRWMHIDVPRHVSHFTEDTLRSLIKECGMEIVRKETFSLHLGIIGMTHTVMSFFGYRGFLLGELKTKRTPLLVLSTILASPVGLVLEWLSSLAGKGGVLRYYLKQSKG